MYGFQPKSARGKAVQQLADGGMVHSIKGMLGLRPKTREELLAADAKAQERNREAAAKMAERAAQQPAPAASAPQSAITDYTGMSAMKRREKEQGLKNGGMVKPHGFKVGGMILGPGTGTSDSIETEKRPGTFIMPADSTQAIGPEALEELGEEAESMERQGGEAVPVRLSNGEFEFTPEEVQALGEAVLTVMRDATHERAEGQQKAMPKAAGFAPAQVFADGGMVENDVTRVGNSYSGGNVGGSVSINGQAGAGTMSTVPAPVASAPATAAAPAASVPTPAATATPATTTATPAAAPAAPMGWAERNAQRDLQVTASSIMDSPERRAAQAKLSPTPAPVAPVAPTTPAVGGIQSATTAMDATKPKPFGAQPASPFGFKPRGYADGGTVRDEEKQRLANQADMYVRGAPAPAAPSEYSRQMSAVGGALADGAAWLGKTIVSAPGYGFNRPDAPAPTQRTASTAGAGRGSVNPTAVVPANVTTTAPVTAEETAQTAAVPTQAAAEPAAAPQTANPNQVAAGFVPGGAPAAISQVVAPTVRNSTNDWAARKALENMATAASSITNRPEWQSGSTTIAGSTRRTNGAGDPDGKVAAYKAALANDLALQQAQPNMEQAAMRENGANQRTVVQDAGATTRTSMQEQGSNTRDARRNALTAEELGLRREAQGFQTRAAAKLESLQNAYAAEKDPAKQAILARQIREFQGKEQPARYKVAAGGQQIDANGVAYKVPDRVFNEQTGEFADVRGAAAPAPIAAPKAGEVRNGYRFKGGNPNDQANWTKV